MNFKLALNKKRVVKKRVSLPVEVPKKDNESSNNDLQVDSVDFYLNSVPNVSVDHQIGDSESDGDEKIGREFKAKRSKIDKIHADFSVLPFKRELYTCTEGGDDYRAENGIEVIGSSASPIKNWFEAGLTLPLLNVIEKLGYDRPTPIQAQSLPLLLSGHNLLAIAPTGCGKTSAFTIPLCRHIAANQSAYAEMDTLGGPFGVVLVPTRELCMQITEELSKFAQPLDVSVLGCYGGVDISVQIAQIVRGTCNIIVATPGRLIDLLAANNGRVLSLHAVTFLVIDETDRMFDMGFGPQVRKVLSVIRPDRQTAVFSATMSSAMEEIVSRILENPVRVVVGLKSTVPPNVEQEAIVLHHSKKFPKLVEILKEGKMGIVFVNTQNLADSLALQLIGAGLKCQALHGGMDQRDRDETINSFRTGELPLLVATSVAARGLDVAQLKIVVNYDPATHLEDYVHRAGRTGRAGNKGKCITFLDQNNKREAYELSQMFKVDAKVKKLADQYNPEEEATNEFNGFGGHGLSKLDKKRELYRSIEKEMYTDGTSKAAPLDLSKIITNIGTNHMAILNINDVSREARTSVTAVHKRNEIIEKYHVAITLKGEFIAKPKPGTDESKKLHLLIESGSYENVAGAYTALLNSISKHSGTEGRYSDF